MNRAGVTWRYLPRRSVKHALRCADGDQRRAPSICGASPIWAAPSRDAWHGTGTQAEYERVEALPECRRCAKLLGAD